MINIITTAATPTTPITTPITTTSSLRLISYFSKRVRHLARSQKENHCRSLQQRFTLDKRQHQGSTEEHCCCNYYHQHHNWQHHSISIKGCLHMLQNITCHKNRAGLCTMHLSISSSLAAPLVTSHAMALPNPSWLRAALYVAPLCFCRMQGFPHM